MKLTVLAVLVAAATCAAGARATPGLQVGITDSGSAYFNTDAFYPDLTKLHAQVLRVQLHWGGALGAAKSRPANAVDPTDPAYDWARYDELVRAADRRGRAGDVHDLRHAAVGERRTPVDVRTDARIRSRAVRVRGGQALQRHVQSFAARRRRCRVSATGPPGTSRTCRSGCCRSGGVSAGTG